MKTFNFLSFKLYYMGNIVGMVVKKNKILLDVKITRSEFPYIKEHMSSEIDVFHSKFLDKKSNFSKRGRRGLSQYLLIPKKLDNVELSKKVNCFKIEKKRGVFLIFEVLKKKVPPKKNQNPTL
jgi:hypothetical protein